MGNKAVNAYSEDKEYTLNN